MGQWRSGGDDREPLRLRCPEQADVVGQKSLEVVLDGERSGQMDRVQTAQRRPTQLGGPSTTAAPTGIRSRPAKSCLAPGSAAGWRRWQVSTSSMSDNWLVTLGRSGLAAIQPASPSLSGSGKASFTKAKASR
ncbi:MAG: hypothetical protein ACREOL_09185 [Candidatus Dormibacteria bacterium]